ncbi:MAG TPA: response regulator [Terriglobales bacterium]|nr:response regulator [Terriglobales bacterium]
MARRILLADDSVTAQNMGRRILHDAGYEVTTVNNGSAALKKIAEHKPDLIILDVYMPGYGGLEVCSRLKENRDTQRIPVLLTVGKLEPFKPEEARRVRADAYVVKPFEASELLAALTKLEDKIVPGPEPYKPGQSAKAMAAVEEDEEEAYGDKETGWKNRLIIPDKKLKQAEAEAEPEPAKGAQRVSREEPYRPAEQKDEFERTMPAGLPADISAEEIAAIAAAAAKINGQGEESEGATPEPVAAAAAEARAEEKQAEETKAEEAQQAAPVMEAASAEGADIREPVAEPAVEAAPEKEVPAATFASAPEAMPAVDAPSPVEKTPEPVAAGDAEESDREKCPVSDAEVLAALAALTPAGGDFSLAAAAQNAVASSASGASLSGPRWIAEAVALSEEESALVLEHEMEKAYAAFAAAEGARMAPAVEAVSGSGNGSGPGESAHRESVPLPEAEVKSEAASPAVPEPSVEAVARETVEAAREEAFAAAASAGTSESASEAQPGASAFNAGNPVNSAEEGSVVRDAELAAAWANWRQIRESIVGEQAPVSAPEPAEETAEEAPVADRAATANAVPQAEPVAEEKQETAEVEESKADTPETPAVESQDPAEISSIVDNMLAELKPKLMEELKRKLKK